MQPQLPQGHSCSVPAIGVNEIFPLCGIERCDLLKMDCEGSELPILLAMSPDALARIESIIMEYHVPSQVDAILGILSHSGFQCEILGESRHCTPAAINPAVILRFGAGIPGSQITWGAKNLATM